jgi:hypothetical protein
MNEGTRRAVAYIAGRLCTGTEANALFDPASGHHASFEGEVGERIAVYDHSRACLIGGVPSAIHDAGTGRYVNLEISRGSFTGYDHASNHHFGGRAAGDEVWIFDCELKRRFAYALVRPAGEDPPSARDRVDLGLRS